MPPTCISLRSRHAAFNHIAPAGPWRENRAFGDEAAERLVSQFESDLAGRAALDQAARKMMEQMATAA
jgi:hypothetical protein